MKKLLLLFFCIISFSLKAQDLAIATTVTNLPCAGSADGAITITVNGGEAPYIYELIDASTSAIISYSTDYGAIYTFAGLEASEYEVKVTSNDSQEELMAVTVEEPELLDLIGYVITPITCNGANDGVIEVEVSGGTAPYQFELYRDGVLSTQTIQSIYSNVTYPNLEEGVYSVIVVDGNNCTAVTQDIILIEPIPFAVNLAIVNDISCSGASNGEIEVTATGGTAPYQFELWDSNGDILATQSSNIFTNLGVGSYNVNVLDAYGCSETIDLIFEEPESLEVAVSINDVSCSGEIDGGIEVTTTGGTAPYQFELWNSNGTILTTQSSNIFTNLGAGSYIVNVLDAYGCVTSQDVIISEPTPLIINSITETASGNEPSGSITVSASGGREPYNYSINNGIDFESLNVFYGLEAGSYEVTVKDANECVSVLSAVTIEQIDVDNSVSVSSDGTLVATYQNADAYQWINVDTGERIEGATEYTFNPTVDGNYQVEMIISDGVIISGKGVNEINQGRIVLSPVINYSSESLSTESFKNVIAVYPNPAKEFIAISSNLLNEKFQIFDLTGKQVSKGIINSNKIDVLGLNEGLYLLKIDNSTVRFVKE